MEQPYLEWAILVFAAYCGLTYMLDPWVKVTDREWEEDIYIRREHDTIDWQLLLNLVTLIILFILSCKGCTPYSEHITLYMFAIIVLSPLLYIVSMKGIGELPMYFPFAGNVAPVFMWALYWFIMIKLCKYPFT